MFHTQNKIWTLDNMIEEPSYISINHVLGLISRSTLVRDHNVYFVNLRGQHKQIRFIPKEKINLKKKCQ